MAKTNAVCGLDIKGSNSHNHQMCEGCIFGKISRNPFPTSHTKSNDIGHIIHSDIGIVPTMTPNGERYYAVFKVNPTIYKYHNHFSYTSIYKYFFRMISAIGPL